MTRLGRERILFGGEAKNGKSYTWMTIAKGLTSYGVKFVVTQPDDGVTKVANEAGVAL